MESRLSLPSEVVTPTNRLLRHGRHTDGCGRLTSPTLTAARPPFCRWMRAMSQSTPPRICCSSGRLKRSGAGSRTQRSLRLRRERQYRRRARNNPAQRSARLGGLLSRMRGPAVCDPPRIAGEQPEPWRRPSVGSAVSGDPPPWQAAPRMVPNVAARVRLPMDHRTARGP